MGTARHIRYPRALLSVLAAACISLASTSEQTQSYPNRTVRMIVPYAAGGSSDLLARVLAEQLRQSLGQPVVVENRPGAGGNIGTEIVSHAPPDSYTILAVGASVAINPEFYSDSVDPIKGLKPIAAIAQIPIVIGEHPSIPVSTMEEFVAFTKANPGKYSYTPCTIRSATQLVVEVLKRDEGLDVPVISYSAGCAAAVPDMLAGRVPFFAQLLSTIADLIDAKRLKTYAVVGDTRSLLLKDVPTTTEAGYPKMNIASNWNGIFGPPALSTEVVTKLNVEINKALARPDVREKLNSQYLEVIAGSPDKFADMVNTETLRFAKLVRDLGLANPK
jgi:tripartite-type tricarboxylate transporter receptor subunit TctC